MNIIRYPEKAEWASIVERPHLDVSQLNATVSGILEDVKCHGDEAVIRYEAKFDHASLVSLAVTEQEIEEACNLVNKDLHDALVLAHDNIYKFHASQQFESKKIETAKGVTCWQKSVPIEKVGLYIPGGTAPLFSTVLMLATPAKIAGCKEIVLCTPPNKEGKVNPAILVAAKIAGVNRIFKTGGVQAIGAMAYGTESIPKVYKIFGPGNQYVMAAKQQVSLHDVAIDMPAGPSEVCVIADANSNATFVAADLLSQAEHGIDSQVFLISTSEEMIAKVQSEVERQLDLLPRKEIAAKTLENSTMVLVKDSDEAMELSNAYAPEHLIIQTRNARELVPLVQNAGSVFVGDWSPESGGDYATGTNHVLPTYGYAATYSSLGLADFTKRMTVQEMTPQGFEKLGPAIAILAHAEELDAHRNAVLVRMAKIKQSKE